MKNLSRLLVVVALMITNEIYAAECSAVFPGPQTFAAGSVDSIESGVTCNGTSCSVSAFTQVNPFPSISPSGDFNSTSISSGVYEHSGWGLGDGAQVTFNGSGTAVIYFKKNDVVIKKDTDINKGGNPANVILIFKGKLKIEENAEINAFIYVKGNETTIEENSTINGAISAKNKLILKKNSTYNYTASDLNSLNTQGFCASSSTVHHYEIVHDGAGLTCENESVTIKACTSSDCSSLSSESVTLDLLGDGSTLTSATFTGSSSVSFSHTTAESLTLSVDNESITANNSLVCDDGSGGSSCDIVFADAGFRFLYGDSNATTINNQTAGDEFTETVKLQAVENSDGVCTGLFSGDVAVDLAQENVTPSGSDGLSFEIDGSAIAKYPSSTSVTLTFDSNSIATLTTPVYKDAGQINLHADYAVSGVTLTGSSNSFWVQPSYLTVSALSDGSDIDGATASASTVHKAGANFTLTVSAYNSQGDVTTNYSPGNMQFKLTRTGPLDTDSVDGTLTYADSASLASAVAASASFTDASLTAFSEGISSFSEAQYSEVGLLNLDIQDSDYGGAGIVVSGNAIDIGRFTPDHYTLLASSIAYSSGDMSYMDQENLLLYYELYARNANDATTENYLGDYVKATVNIVAENDNDGIDLSARLSGATASWDNGVYSAVNDTWTFSRLSSAVDGPYDNLLIAIEVIDSDGVLLENLDITVDEAADDCETDGDCSAKILDSTEIIVRFGRWYLQNSYGPETLALRMPMSVQYWDGSNFVTNTSDSFTAFSSSSATITDISLAPATTTASGSGTFVSGESNMLTLSSPGAGNRGSVMVEFDVPEWLKYDWDNDGAYDDNPSAQATFGLYRGNDRIIYRQEVFE